MKIGQHFTPDDLADKLIHDSARRWPKKRRISICDPACGDGQILLAAQRYCDANGINAEYYGFDLDPVAAEQCRKNMPNAKVEVCDFLTREALPFEFDVFLGNPPFLGGNKISGTFGSDYLKMLKEYYPGPVGDYNAYFLRAMDCYFPSVISTINTNTISQGKTRELGLKFLTRNGYEIFCADTNIPWPGGAQVTISMVHLSEVGQKTLVNYIDKIPDQDMEHVWNWICQYSIDDRRDQKLINKARNLREIEAFDSFQLKLKTLMLCKLHLSSYDLNEKLIYRSNHAEYLYEILREYSSSLESENSDMFYYMFSDSEKLVFDYDAIKPFVLNSHFNSRVLGI